MAKLAAPAFIDNLWEAGTALLIAAMAKLADAQDLGSCSERSGGSNPSRRMVRRARYSSLAIVLTNEPAFSTITAFQGPASKRV